MISIQKAVIAGVVHEASNTSLFKLGNRLIRKGTEKNKPKVMERGRQLRERWSQEMKSRGIPTPLSGYAF